MEGSNAAGGSHQPATNASPGRGHISPPPRVSIITAYYLGMQFLSDAIESVRAQTMTEWEHLVVDDGSPDDCSAVVSGFAATDDRLTLIRRSNGGVCKARNTGAAAASARSDFLLFLDQDDRLAPQMLAIMVAYLDSHPEVGMAFCEPVLIDATNDVLDDPGRSPGRRYVPSLRGVRRLPAQTANTPFVSLFVWSNLVPSICLLRRSTYESVGGWDESVQQGPEDQDLFLRIALVSEVHYVPYPLAYRRMHADQRFRGDLLTATLQRHYEKWLTGHGLSHAEKSVVRKAWYFRQSRLMPYMWLSWSMTALRQGDFRSAKTCCMRSLKRLTQAALISRRRQLKAEPIW